MLCTPFRRSTVQPTATHKAVAHGGVGLPAIARASVFDAPHACVCLLGPALTGRAAPRPRDGLQVEPNVASAPRVSPRCAFQMPWPGSHAELRDSTSFFRSLLSFATLARTEDSLQDAPRAASALAASALAAADASPPLFMATQTSLPLYGNAPPPPPPQLVAAAIGVVEKKTSHPFCSNAPGQTDANTYAVRAVPAREARARGLAGSRL
eukprot:4358310-Pleurochrysis_carterae.AAC.1